LGTDPTIGLAEYTNANFFSQNTIFSPSFPFPTRSSVQLKADKEIVPKTGELRRYITKVRDGEVIDHFAVPSSLLEFLPADLQTKKIGFDETVFGDYAAKLFPRAVGYSAALLDYFFRGKLDVDLVQPDSDNASLLQLIGANGSDDPLVDGTLTLYSDSPSGVRTSVTSVRVNGVQKGQELFSTPVTFQAPEDAERRFVAVYTGKLGLEEPAGDFPGGVIGKVLGGVRVEEVFSDGIHWRLRTPTGVFLLPLMVAEFEEVRWGDGDDILVARTPLGLDQPSRVVTYEVLRQAGSAEPVTADTPNGPEVKVRQKYAALFPFEMSLGTTVDFNHRTQFRQRVARVDPRRNVFRWVPHPPFCPRCGEYVFDHAEVGAPRIETVQTIPISFKEQFLIRLDLARNAAFGTAGRPYVWDLREVGADALGRPLVVVVVTLTTPESPPVAVPVIGLNQETGALEVVGEISVAPSFPPGMNRSLWAVVNLITGEVVSTAGDRVTVVFDEGGAGGVPDIYEHGSIQFTGGGPDDAIFDGGWFRVTLQLADPRIALASVTNVLTGSSLAIALSGWLKEELTRLKDPLKVPATGLGLFDVQLGPFQSSADLAYDCPPTASEVPSCHVLRVTDSSVGVTRGAFEILDARRSRPAPAGGERLVFLAGGPAGSGVEDTILAWDPQRPSARALTQLPPVGESFHFLGPATGATVLIPGGNSFLIPLDGARPRTDFPGVNLGTFFTLLDPGYLYSVQELKFFRSKPPLERTALPAKLADLPDRTNLVGDYHAIRLP
jgi:hypothetical protein